jgi:hypothetical protein
VSEWRHIWQASHHRAGTVLVKKILGGRWRRHTRPVVRLLGEHPIYEQLGPRRGVPVESVGLDGEALHLLDNHSRIRPPRDLDLIGIHVIRDPRAMIRSAYIYHQSTHERWAHEVRSEHGDRSYRDVLRNHNAKEGLLFEIENMATTLMSMLEWDYDDERFLEIHFEDLEAGRLDNQIIKFMLETGTVSSVRSARRHLARTSPVLYRKSDRFRPAHRRHSSHGAAGLSWDQAHEERFVRLFGDEFSRLGYPSS